MILSFKVVRKSKEIKYKKFIYFLMAKKLLEITIPNKLKIVGKNSKIIIPIITEKIIVQDIF